MRIASLYELPDRILIHPMQRTTAGLYIASEPYITLQRKVDEGTLSDGVRRSLSSSGQTVPHPDNWTALSEPRLIAAGVKSERAFQSNARHVGIEERGANFHLTPSRNGGAAGDSKGFHHLNDLELIIPSTCTSEELGQAIRTVLDRCQ